MVPLCGVGIVNRMLLCSLACFAVVLGIVHAAPDRRPLEPDVPKAPPPLELRGTTWQGQDHVANYRVTFEHDGTLSYGYGGKQNRGGSWTLQGRQVYWEVN